ncbi:MAG: FecCD family ABC transporter permease [Candidatus Bipolaricaulia bacterium]
MSKGLIFAILAGLALVSLLSAAAVGPVTIPLGKSLALIFRPDGSLQSAIVREIRLPRALLGFAIGLALALAGAVLQGLFRNPLADPYILGIAGGATTGAAIVISLGWSGPLTLPLGAFLGGLLAASLVYRLAKRARGTSPFSLILAGVALGAAFASITSFIIFLTAGDRRLSELLFWGMGSLGRASWPYLWALLPVAFLGMTLLQLRARELNALALGEEGAQHLGLEPEHFKRALLAVTTLLTSTAVAFAGTIGFVGLITPHVMRLILGPDHRFLLPASALAGGIFLVWADAAARTVMRPAELPLGVITALVGAPFFLYLLRTRPGGEMR